MGINLDLSDVRALAAQIQVAGPRVGGQVSTSVRKTGQAILTAAQANAPYLTGELHGSGSLSVQGDGRFGEMIVEVTFDSDHAAYVEFGTSDTAAQPYVGPAFDTHAPQAAAGIADAAASIF